MGWLDKLFGGGEDPADRADFEMAGQVCARCGDPIPKGDLALDSGSGKAVHRSCPTNTTIDDAKTSLTK